MDEKQASITESWEFYLKNFLGFVQLSAVFFCCSNDFEIASNQRWNLQMENSQAHAAMDKYGYINYEITCINSHLNKW